jgi:hypothetical protein
VSEETGPAKKSAFEPCGFAAVALATFGARCHLGWPRGCEAQKNYCFTYLYEATSPELGLLRANIAHRLIPSTY